MPILGDLYEELLKQPEPEALRVAAALELYVTGSLNAGANIGETVESVLNPKHMIVLHLGINTFRPC